VFFQIKFKLVVNISSKYFDEIFIKAKFQLILSETLRHESHLFGYVL